MLLSRCSCFHVQSVGHVDATSKFNKLMPVLAGRGLFCVLGYGMKIDLDTSKLPLFKILEEGKRNEKITFTGSDDLKRIEQFT